MRKSDQELLFVVVNFGEAKSKIGVKIPAHAFDFLNIPEQDVTMFDLLSGDIQTAQFRRDGLVRVSVDRWNGRVFKVKL